MNDDKLRERIEKLKVDADELLVEPQVMNATDGVFAQTKEWAISVTDLITAYRQLEKDNKKLDEKHDDCIDNLCDAADEYFKMKETNAELLAALEPFATANKVKNPPDAIPYREYEKAEQVYNKHKGE